MLHIGPQNINVVGKLKKKLNEKCDLEICFDNTFKGDNNILSIVSWTYRIIDWIVRNITLREQSYIYNPNKTL